MAQWPELSYASWRETCTALHLWSQIAGKIRLAQTPWLNHSWHVALYVTPRGLTSSPIPDGERSFELLFDFVRSALRIETSDGAERAIALKPRSVADFYAEVRSVLAELGIRAQISELPNEIPNAVRFSEDTAVRAYSPDDALRFWRALVQIDRVFKRFRTGFLGKTSPVHFFWGSFDLA
ncbi:MAG TPA: DUF5996 family protein, partial [Polyangiales bacterium]|nr:DUF5996 family protein [Polyangiales bacterium]